MVEPVSRQEDQVRVLLLGFALSGQTDKGVWCYLCRIPVPSSPA